MNHIHMNIIQPDLKLVAWEITAKCNLNCAHCRLYDDNNERKDELTTQECYQLIEQIARVSRPVIILTGGEPLCRTDIIDIGRYATERGMRVVLGSNGTLVTEEAVNKLKTIPISRLSISIDFPNAEKQDEFRGRRGAFVAAMRGIKNAQKANIPVQINSTITKLNLPFLNDLVEFALSVGAVAFHPFLLVPTGRGKGLANVQLSPDEYEETLNWIYLKQQLFKDKMFFKPTDAPQYLRVVYQKNMGDTLSNGSISKKYEVSDCLTRGCLAGTSFCFISSTGKVKGCGYLNIEAGDIRKQTFKQIWEESLLFNQLRNLNNLKGKCGVCEYKIICGGCRARAYEFTGDCLASEPDCVYIPNSLNMA